MAASLQQRGAEGAGGEAAHARDVISVTTVPETLRQLLRMMVRQGVFSSAKPAGRELWQLTWVLVEGLNLPKSYLDRGMFKVNDE